MSSVISSKPTLEELPNRDLKSAESSYHFLAISSKRLIVLSLLTLGLYVMYWFFKQWKAFQKMHGLKIYPLVRSIFQIFFCYSLFNRVLKLAKEYGYPSSYSPSILSITYIFLCLCNVSGKLFSLSEVQANIIYLVGLVGCLALLLKVQKAINFIHHKINELDVRKSFSTSELIIACIGVFLFIGFIFGFIE